MPRFTHDHDPLLGPPAHLLAEVHAAWERAQDPRRASSNCISLARSKGGRGVTGRAPFARGASRSICLSAGEALALACGDAALVLAA